MPLLTARSLRVAAGGHVLIDALDLDIAAGSGVAITGPSGSGKTTLLRALAALDQPDGGEIRLRGRTPAELGFTSYRRVVHYVPAAPVFSGETVDDSLRRVFAFACAERSYDPSQARSLLDLLHLPADILERQPTALSTGERQRLAVARAGLITPQVLLLDEPTSALDETARSAVEGLVREAMRRGAGVVCVTHDAAQAERLGLTRVAPTAAEMSRA